MESTKYHNHLTILRHELQVALGCTEPIAIAFAAAKARQVLGKMPESCLIQCSGNIVKNVKGVTVPNSGGLRGIEVAAILGIVGGNPDRELAVLESVTDANRAQVRTLLTEQFCTCELIKNVENLYIIAQVRAGEESALVEIREEHSNITQVIKNGVLQFEKAVEKSDHTEEEGDPAAIDLHSILEFADSAALSDLEPVLKTQVEYNCAISQEGLTGKWGVQAGKSLLTRHSDPDLHIQARAAASAGSDARMSGCALPVVINCGSGNQGITVTMPIVVYAKAYHSSQEQMYRALALANLIAVHQKKYIGRLSAYCGVVSAATAAACGIVYLLLEHEPEEQRYLTICRTITNSICTIGGMVCDGAKSSCATKISVAVENALMAMDLAMEQHVFQPGEGLTMDTAEETIQAMGRVGREGMRSTDLEILNIMLGH